MKLEIKVVRQALHISFTKTSKMSEVEIAVYIYGNKATHLMAMHGNVCHCS